jgi:hypothetical protein
MRVWSWKCRDCAREGADVDEEEVRVAAIEHEDETLHGVDVSHKDRPALPGLPEAA